MSYLSNPSLWACYLILQNSQHRAFIFIVGFHLIRHYTKQLVYKEYISEKATHLLIPYFFWSILYLLTTNDLITLQGGIKSLLLGTAAPHLWYVIMMFQIHLLFPFTMHTFFIGFKNEQKIKKDIYKYMTFFRLPIFSINVVLFSLYF